MRTKLEGGVLVVRAARSSKARLIAAHLVSCHIWSARPAEVVSEGQSALAERVAAAQREHSGWGSFGLKVAHSRAASTQAAGLGGTPPPAAAQP